MTYPGQVSSPGSPTPCRTDVDLSEPPRGPLAALRRVPVAVQAVVLLTLVVVGSWIGGPLGGTLLLIVAGLLLAALAVSWSLIAMPERLLRFATAFLVLAVALVRFFPR